MWIAVERQRCPINLARIVLFPFHVLSVFTAAAALEGLALRRPQESLRDPSILVFVFLTFASGCWSGRAAPSGNPPSDESASLCLFGQDPFVDKTHSLYMPSLVLLALTQTCLFWTERETCLLSTRLSAFSVHMVYLFAAAAVEILALGGGGTKLFQRCSWRDRVGF